MIGKIIDKLGDLMKLLNKVTEIVNFVLTGYAKAEEKREELSEKTVQIARIAIISIISGGVALIIFFIVRAIVKKVKKVKANRIQRQIELQQELQCN